MDKNKWYIWQTQYIVLIKKKWHGNKYRLKIANQRFDRIC